MYMKACEDFGYKYSVWLNRCVWHEINGLNQSDFLYNCVPYVIH